MRVAITLSHRQRLTLVATAVSAAVLLLIFLVAMSAFRRSQYTEAGDILEPALDQLIGEIHEKPSDPDYREVGAISPGLTAVYFDAHGHRLGGAGPLQLRPLLGSGKTFFGAQVAVYQGIRYRGGIAEVALPWVNRSAEIRAFGELLAALWAVSVAIIATVTWFATKATFQPLARLADEAEKLSGELLSGRLRIEDDAEYGAFAERLNRFLDRLEGSVRREERFVADAAHELRTPLTVLRGQVETALLRGREPAEYEQTLRTILAESERLSRMVELLLQSTVPATTEVPPIDLEATLERAHARWVDRFESHDVRLDIASCPASVQILASEFDVVIDNLLSNALKASPSGTRSGLSLERRDGFARIEVTNEGQPIAAESAERIFERFARLDSGRNRAMGGFGIGLAVCRRVVTNRDGRVSVEPRADGACFVVELPLAIGAQTPH